MRPQNTEFEIITKKMKKIIFLFVTFLALSSCAPKLTEQVEARFPNGQPQYVKTLNKSGDCVKWSEYYETGQLKMEGPMKDGKREGEWKAYLPDGRIKSQGYFEDGQRTGAAKVYWDNGNLREEGFYKEGKHCGKWRYYDEQGNFLREDDYGE